ncbi:hypothetical protein [Massilia putida]|uniref:hypothetical protein n=1 Tax=Massilia putida TaxID=1141883 RepID=UPI0012EB655C|nr:hypothetical protein [Massilia putida]
MKRIFTMSLVLGLVSACGGGHDDAQPPVAAQAPAPMPTPGGSAGPDKFAAQVASVVATSSDDAEAALLDDGPPSVPDDTEPGPVTP